MSRQHSKLMLARKFWFMSKCSLSILFMIFKSIQLIACPPTSASRLWEKYVKFQGWPVADPGVLTYYSTKYLLNTTWKWKKLDPSGGAPPSTHPWIRHWCPLLAISSWWRDWNYGSGPRVFPWIHHRKKYGLPVLCRKEVQQALLFCLPFSLHDDNVCNCLLLRVEYFFD